MSELFLVVSLRAKAGKEEELRRDLMAVVAPSRKEKGMKNVEAMEFSHVLNRIA